MVAVLERQLGIKMRQGDTLRLEGQITVIADVIKTHPYTSLMQCNYCQSLEPVLHSHIGKLIFFLGSFKLNESSSSALLELGPPIKTIAGNAYSLILSISI